MRHTIPTSAALLLWSAAALAGGQEVPIEFRESADLKGVTPYGGAYTSLSREAPAGEWKLPELASAQPLFGVAKLGDSEFLLVVDDSQGGKTTYDRVYFDSNGDRDLTDEEAFEGTVMEFEEHSYFVVRFEDQVFVDYELDGETYPYVLELQISGSTEPMEMPELPEGVELPEGFTLPSPVSIGLNTACCYVGEFVLGERQFQLRLGDSDCDGRFDETMNIPTDQGFFVGGDQLYPMGDHLYLTHEKKVTYNDQLPLGDHLIVGEELFGVRVDIPNGKLLLTELTADLVPLKLSRDPLRLVAHARDFEHSIMMYDPPATVRVPAGEYRLLSYSMLGTGEQGDVWRIEGGATKKTPFVTVNGASEALMSFGEPFLASAEVSPWFRDAVGEDGETETMIDFRIRGIGQELVTDLAYVKGSGSSIAMSSEEPNRPAEPTYTIVKKDGELVKTGAFEYG